MREGGIFAEMKTFKIVGWLILIVSAVLWVASIGSAVGRGFFEDQNAVQLMVLGGAVSMIAGLFLWYGD